MKSRRTLERLRATLFVMPAFLLHLAVVTIPASTLLYYAFTSWSGLGRATFNGLTNFHRMLTDDAVFGAALFNNMTYMAVFLTVPIILGLALALLMKRLGRSQMLYRTVFFMPYVLSAVVIGRIFVAFYSPYQGLGKLFDALGLESLAGVAVLGNRSLALFAVAFANVWYWWGFLMALFVTALHQVDAELYEAASLEGASGLQQFWNVTVPQIMPTIVTVVMITVIGSFLTFDWVWAMTRGGPAGATEMASTWIYKNAFLRNDAGYAAAMSLVICVICIGIYFGFRALQKRGWNV